MISWKISSYHESLFYDSMLFLEIEYDRCYNKHILLIKGVDFMPKSPTTAKKDEIKKYSNQLIESKNIIFRGAPGTGKTHLAKSIAAYIVSDGKVRKYEELNDEQKSRVGFVQFHPSYDYTDFVEGIRPTTADDGNMKFELKDGIFKTFVDAAITNYESTLSSDAFKKEKMIDMAIKKFLDEVDFDTTKYYTTKTKNEFYITNVDNKNIYISIPNNATIKNLTIKIDRIKRLLKDDKMFTEVKELVEFFNQKYHIQENSYELPLYQKIKGYMDYNHDEETQNYMNQNKKIELSHKKPLPYIFIIDEINRGDISKIFGELFFSIDPGYRGKEGSVFTQYANMHEEPNQKFYIPDNVYIIGTMNDIDRSIDSFDFAMRRRFRFIELKANDCTKILEELNDQNLKNEATQRLKDLNEAIKNTEDLNENYQIGAAYFLKLKELNFDELWTDCLEPLLKEYVQGTYNEKENMRRFAKAYRFTKELDTEE